MHKLSKIRREVSMELVYFFFFSCVRKGAPFLHSIDAVKQRLLEAGLVNYWLSDLIEAAAQKARMELKAEGRQVQVGRDGGAGH